MSLLQILQLNHMHVSSQVKEQGLCCRADQQEVYFSFSSLISTVHQNGRQHIQLGSKDHIERRQRLAVFPEWRWDDAPPRERATCKRLHSCHSSRSIHKVHVDAPDSIHLVAWVMPPSMDRTSERARPRQHRMSKPRIGCCPRFQRTPHRQSGTSGVTMLSMRSTCTSPSDTSGGGMIGHGIVENCSYGKSGKPG